MINDAQATAKKELNGRLVRDNRKMNSKSIRGAVDPFDGQAEVCSARGSVDIQPGLSAGRLVDRIEDASRANPVGAGEPW